ncbi:YbfB/YjiJ family MFS transporter [Acidovorax sp. NCPPB 3859]|nr:MULTISPECIES: YbfB/YjiJ family MFS transporter [unclassified Acidovorax]MDA8449910.1 YbfB/YjiJ family MFS transporter [Acidovorax sp. GBBC 3297]MDA8459355.1 YbfB/YjiJ family MFS transporter [Acidovorax sp. GBBC 3333]MDA8464392.1 YbfB/YjiJ family MFS transporter [Acidovorax sp. GBBC 3332]MDA8469397.1 YbfB/YjiJ family MFS transporter [Acidovorax sp. GBBC 3299]WCM79033.1 YbfB/YjiJ family MFS transporter [Acidovorax sp. GBBC 712]
MAPDPAPSDPDSMAPALWERPLAVALAGMAALGAAMGIGRFAFTPLLPMMLGDGVLTLAGGSWLATVNYVGYLVGALVCMALPWLAPGTARSWQGARLTRWGLAVTVLLTCGMALPLPGTWPLLRAAAGVASAVVFLNVSSWCMARLVALGQPALGGLIFCGPGLGIALTGLSASAMVSAHWRAAAGWAVFGLLCALLCALVWPVVRGAAQPAAGAPGPASAPTAAPAARGGRPARALLTLAYGLAGLGYIVTATFLPVIARGVLPAGSPWPDLFWPVFGAGVALGAALSTRTPAAWDRRRLLAGCYVLQAFSIGLGLAWPGVPGFALGSLLLGLPFTAITFYALQEARRIWPAAGDSFAGLLTVAYGLGQIAGPPLVAWALHHAATPQQGFAHGLAMAAGALGLGAAVLGAMAWRWPPQPEGN